MGNVDLVHSHTWYANMSGHLTSLLYGIPHVRTNCTDRGCYAWRAEAS